MNCAAIRYKGRVFREDKVTIYQRANHTNSLRPQMSAGPVFWDCGGSWLGWIVGGRGAERIIQSRIAHGGYQLNTNVLKIRKEYLVFWDDHPVDTILRNVAKTTVMSNWSVFFECFTLAFSLQVGEKHRKILSQGSWKVLVGHDSTCLHDNFCG